MHVLEGGDLVGRHVQFFEEIDAVSSNGVESRSCRVPVPSMIGVHSTGGGTFIEIVQAAPLPETLLVIDEELTSLMSSVMVSAVYVWSLRAWARPRPPQRSQSPIQGLVVVPGHLRDDERGTAVDCSGAISCASFTIGADSAEFSQFIPHPMLTGHHQIML